jgi:hypothetical protein
MKFLFYCFVSILIAGLGYCTKIQAQNLPAGYIGTVNETVTNTYQLFSYSFTASATGVDYVGLAFRQDPGYWSVGSLKLTAGSGTSNLLLNGNLQYGGSTSTGLQAPADWGVWYQNGTYPAAAGTWFAPGSGWMGSTTSGLGVNTGSSGSWIDGAVGSFDGIYQGFNATAGTTYNFSFYSSGSNPYSNPSIMIGVYAGACASGSSVFSCTPAATAGFTALATPAQTAGTGGAPTIVSQATTSTTSSTIISGSQQQTITTPTITYTWSDGTTTTGQGSATTTVVSNSAFTGVHFGSSQVADTQWNVSACMYTTTCQIYSTNPGGTYETGSWHAITSTQYVTFIPNTGSDSATNPWTMILVNADGTFSALGTGRVLVQGSDSSGHIYLFFTNNNLNGTLLSGNLGLTGQGMTFSGTANPTAAQTNTLSSNMSSSPLTAGQTGGTGATSAPTVVSTTNTTITTTTVSGSTTYTYSQPVTITTYSDNSTTTVNNGTATLISTTVTGGSSTITSTQQSFVTGVSSRMPGAGSNSIYINQTGTGDNINITQVGAGNKIDGATNTGNSIGYATAAPITGGSNHITVRQHGNNNLMDVAALGGSNTLNLNQGTDSSGNYTGLDQGGHYQFDYVNGTGNNVTVVQENTATGSGQFSSLAVVGNLNTVGITQTGNAQKQLFASVSGNSNTVTTTQTGTSTAYLNISVSGNGNSAVVSQTNTGASGANNASITLVNAGAPASVNLTQTGGQNYSISQTCATTCGTVTVRQGN